MPVAFELPARRSGGHGQYIKSYRPVQSSGWLNDRGLRDRRSSLLRWHLSRHHQAVGLHPGDGIQRDKFEEVWQTEVYGSAATWLDVDITSHTSD